MTARTSIVDASNTEFIDSHAADAEVAARKKNEELARGASGSRSRFRSLKVDSAMLSLYISTGEANVSPTPDLSTPSKTPTPEGGQDFRSPLSNNQISNIETGDSSPNTSPNASRLSMNSLSSTPRSSIEADDLFKAVKDETKRQCAEESAAEKRQMKQQHEEELAAETKQFAARDKRTRKECAETIDAKEAENEVKLAKEKSDLEATKNTEQRNTLIAQKQILEGRHNKETAAKTKEHAAQLAAKEKQQEAQLVAVRESVLQQAIEHMIPKREVEALTKYVKTFPQGFETIQTDGTKLLCGLDAVVKTMEAMYPSLPRPTVPQMQALLKSNDWQKQVEDFSVKDYNPEKFSAYEIDMTNENNFRVDQLGSLLTLWGHIDGRNLNLRIGCFVDKQGPELLFHANEDHAIIVWIHNDAVNLEFPNMIKGHYKGMKPFDHAGRAAAEKVTAALVEELSEQQSKDREIIEQLSQQYENVVIEKENLGAKVAGLETANTDLECKADQLTENVAGFKTDKASPESKAEQLMNDVTKSEADKTSLEKKVQQLQEGALSKENTKLRALYKASVTTTVKQGTLIAELQNRQICQCGGLRPASTPGQPARKAVGKGGKAKPFIFGDSAVETGATADALGPGELAAKPINKAKKPSKKAKSSGFTSNTPPSEQADYVERTNIFDIGDSAVKAGDKARASNIDGSAKKPAHETEKPSPFTFGASAMEYGEVSGNSGFQFKVPVAKPAGPSECTIPFRLKKSARKVGEESRIFSFGASTEKAAEEPATPNHVDSEQPVKKSRGMPASDAPDVNAADFPEGPYPFGLGNAMDKTGENEKKTLNAGKLTDPLVCQSTKPAVSKADSVS